MKMGPTPQTIWKVPAYLPYIQPALTDEAVAQAENQIGHNLPTELLDLLKVQNGGYIRYSHPDLPQEKIAGIGPHFPSLTRFDWDNAREYVSYSLDGLVPIDGDGHWHVCLDYRGGGLPSVTFADVECDEEAGIAESFEDYLSQLRVRIDDELVLEGADLEVVAEVLSASLGVAFGATETRAHGYAVKSAHVQNPGSLESIWLSPNLVARGFVRPEDRRYAELKDLLPGQSPRHPEIPRDCCLVKATVQFRQKVVQACLKAGFKTRPLREYFEMM